MVTRKVSVLPIEMKELFMIEYLWDGLAPHEPIGKDALFQDYAGAGRKDLEERAHKVAKPVW